VRRTQLYLDEDLWKALQIRARAARTTISELVRQAARERYLSESSARKQAMTDFIAIWKNRPEFNHPENYVRRLRRDGRLKRIRGKS